jgi:hypothetical protein
MRAYLIGALAARAATALCVLLIALPYVLRRNRLRRGLRPAQENQTQSQAQENSPPYLQRLWPHFWVGYLILALSTLHAGTVTPAMGRANGTGIWAATAAFFLLLFEIVLGLSLKETNCSPRRPLRRLHFWMMAAFVAALGAHLWFNA